MTKQKRASKKKPIKKLSRKTAHAVRRNLRVLKTRYVMLCFAVIAALIAWFLLAHHTSQPSRLVTFHDRGQDHVILTRATTVRKALADAHIAVAPQDVVEPAIDSQLLTTDSAVIIYRSRPVLIVDGSLKQKIVTAAASPNEIMTAAGLAAISDKDKAGITEGDIISSGTSAILTVERAEQPAPKTPNLFQPGPNALSPSKGAQLFTDSSGVTHRETYYDLPMNIVIGACGSGGYTIRYDGAKIDKDGYVLVAANYQAYPKCSVVETSMGLGKVYDTGGFALRYPHGFDLATDWTNGDGR